MLTRRTLARRVCAGLLFAFVTAPAWAAPASDTILPNTTKGYVTVAQAKQFEDRWDTTQLGQLFNDDIMRPFVEDFRRQLRENVGSIERKLGIVWDDIQGVPNGELSLSLIERKNAEAVYALTMDVTGREKEANGLVAAVEKRFAARGGKRSNAQAGDTTLIVFDAPTNTPGKNQQTVIFVKDNLFCAIDDRAEAEAMLKRFAGNATDNLKSLPAYAVTMSRCQKEAGSLQPEARWFIEPFGFVFAERTLRQRTRTREQDLVKILYDNGFSAVQGAGGYVNQLVEGHVEFLVRTAVYAPAAKGKENDPLRWNLSMRMMQFPNGPVTEPASWVPRIVASYSTMNVNLAAAFDNVGPLFDAIQEHEDAWKNTLDAWSNDSFGPQVDVRKDFIGNLTNRVSVITSYDTPINENSERSVFAIEAKNEAALTKTLEKWMKNEHDIKRHEVGQYVIWERNPQAAPQDVVIPGFETVRSNKATKNDRERVLPNAAVTVALGHLMMASDVGYLTEILGGFAQRDRLASSADYQQLTELLTKLAPGDRSGWAFGRGDEEVRPMYELVRQNRMPESKSMMGKLLNNFLTSEADRKAGKPRQQKVDGALLPDFEAVRRYFGPHGRVVRSDQDGWFITGAILNTQAP